MLLTPQQLRERLVQFYMGSFKRAYGGADRASLERKVIADLEYVDSAKRLSPPPTHIRPAAPPPRVADDIAAKVGATLTKARPHARHRPAFLYGNPMLVSERWGAANARIMRILEGAKGSTLLESAKNSQVPHLAREVLDALGYYLSSGAPAPAKGVDHNPFRGLSQKDAARLLMRKFEDICDRSTRELGGWYVK